MYSLIRALQDIHKDIVIKNLRTGFSILWSSDDEAWLVKNLSKRLSIYCGDSFEDALKALLKEE